MNPLRLIFMGTPEFAAHFLRCLDDSRHRIVAAYTQPPRPAGRGHKLLPSPVQQEAERRGIQVFSPTSLRKPQVQEQFKDFQADAAIVAAYGLILPQPILNGTRLGCINIHPSKLPRWRGAAPLQRQIMAGDTETAMTIMQMDAGLDTGPMLAQRCFPLALETTVGQLHDKMQTIGAEMLLDVLDDLQRGTAIHTPQPAEGATYAAKIDKQESRIDWTKPATEVRALIHGLSRAPGAFTTFGREVLKLHEAQLADRSGLPGTVLDDRLTIACGNGAIRPTLVQRAGKAPMTTDELLRGLVIPAGAVLV